MSHREGDQCPLCRFNNLSYRGGHLQCSNCGWMAPSNTASEAAEVPGAKEVVRSTPPYSADNGDSKSVAALDRSRAQAPLASNEQLFREALEAIRDANLDDCCPPRSLQEVADAVLRRASAETKVPHIMAAIERGTEKAPAASETGERTPEDAYSERRRGEKYHAMQTLLMRVAHSQNAFSAEARRLLSGEFGPSNG